MTEARDESTEALFRRLEAVEATVARHAVLLEQAEDKTRSLSPGTETGDLAVRVWQSAPLSLRLAFLRDLLGSEHPGHAVLREAGELVELCGRGSETENWLRAYPLLFVEAAVRLMPSESGTDDVARLAAETLAEARTEVDAFLRAAGGEWIFPSVGAPAANEHEILGEEPAPNVPAGRVARVVRPGLRWRGQLLLPAQVIRASGAAAPVQPLGASPEGAASPVAVQTLASRDRSDGPEWYLRLLRQSVGEKSPAVAAVMDGLAELLNLAEADTVDPGRLRTALTSLLPLLSPSPSAWPESLSERWLEVYAAVRPSLQEWLAATFGVGVIWPEAETVFDPETMDAVSIRRTAHPQERGKVARARTSGLRLGEQVLCRAQVVRYEPGGGE